MTKEAKFVIGAFVVTIILMGGLAFALTRSSTAGAGGTDKFVPTNEIQNLTVDKTSIDLGQIKYSGGIVSGAYEIKNSGEKSIRLRKIVTSCMCTKASVKIGNKSTKFFSMEMNGDLNPLIDNELKSGESATLIFQFDPAAHGPQGIGKIDRIVTLFFDAGLKDFKFNGEVVN